MPKKLSKLIDATNRLYESAHTLRKRRALRELEKEMAKDLQAFFLKQGRLFLMQFHKYRDLFSESVGGDEADRVFERIKQETEELLKDIIIRRAGQAISSAAGHLLSDIGIGISFTLENPRAVEYLQMRAAERVRAIDETTRQTIKNIIVRGAEEGKSYSAIAREIERRYSRFAVGDPREHIRSRAELIAVTEVGEAYEEGNEIVAQEIQQQGIIMEKFWLTMQDARVSDGCLENEQAGWIPLDDPFPSGHMHPLRFPGCRCDCLYRRRRE